jgi:hypothetical protein
VKTNSIEKCHGEKYMWKLDAIIANSIDVPLTKLKVQLPYDPNLSMYVKGNEIRVFKKYNAHYSIIYNS